MMAQVFTLDGWKSEISANILKDQFDKRVFLMMFGCPVLFCLATHRRIKSLFVTDPLPGRQIPSQPFESLPSTLFAKP